MQVTTALGHALLRKHLRGQHVSLGVGVVRVVANVQLNGQIAFVRDAQLRPKRHLLHVRGKLVVRTEVEAYLPHAHAARTVEKDVEPSQRLVRKLGRTIGMRPRDDAHVVHEVGHIPTGELRGNKPVLGALVQALGCTLHPLVQPREQRLRRRELSRHLVHGIDGHHQQADSRQRGAADGD